MLKNRFGDPLLVSLKEGIVGGQAVNGMTIFNEMVFTSTKYITKYSSSPGQSTCLALDNSFIYPYKALEFKNIDYGRYNTKMVEDPVLRSSFFEPIMIVPINTSAAQFRMIGECSWWLTPSLIEWCMRDSVSINIGGEELILF